MNVYDFDLTIYPTDCAIDFCIWCMKRHPKLWFTYFPKLVKVMIQRKRGKIPEYLKHRKFLSYLTMIDDFDEQIEKYWNKNEKQITPMFQTLTTKRHTIKTIRFLSNYIRLTNQIFI